ncbi:MAG: tetratricopeptide repeat protein [bacterium]|nr:tetratricopeptide repeat protein [bacterium]
MLLACLLVLSACQENPSAELFLEAGDALREGRVEEALSYYNKVVSLYPNSDAAQEAHYWVGEIYRLFKKQPEEGISFFRKALAQGGQTRFAEKAQRNIAEIYISDLKNHKKAIPELQQLIDKFPDSTYAAEAQYLIGQCYMAIGEYEQARIEFNTLLDRHTSSDYRDDAAYRAAVAYYRSGSFSKAREEYENFIALYPDSPLVLNARLGLVNSLEELKEIDEALTQLVSLEKEYPNQEIILRKVDSLLKKKSAKSEGLSSKEK